MFQKFSDQNQEITVNHINFIVRFLCIFSEIMEYNYVKYEGSYLLNKGNHLA